MWKVSKEDLEDECKLLKNWQRSHVHTCTKTTVGTGRYCSDAMSNAMDNPLTTPAMLERFQLSVGQVSVLLLLTHMMNLMQAATVPVARAAKSHGKEKPS